MSGLAAFSRNKAKSAWAQIERDTARRRSKPGRVTVVQERTNDQFALVSAGTALAFFGEAGSPLLRRIKREAGSSKTTTRKLLAFDVSRQLASTPARFDDKPATLAREVVAAPVYGRLSFGSAVLGEAMTVSDEKPLGVLPLAYNGGRLPTEQFSFEQLVTGRKRPPDLEVVVVARPPELSALERSATRVVDRAAGKGDETAQMLVLGPIVVGVWPAVVFYMVTVTVTGTLCFKLADAMSEIHLSDAQVDRLGPNASVAKLMDLRREALLAHS